jgi:hypothetical protein
MSPFVLRDSLELRIFLVRSEKSAIHDPMALFKLMLTTMLYGAHVIQFDNILAEI